MVKTTKPIEKVKLLIWTEMYRPFMMGGDVNAPGGCEIDVDPEMFIDLGNNVKVVPVIDCYGTTHIVEVRSGGIVGNNLDDVRNDLATASAEDVEKSIIGGIARRKKVTDMPPQEFWDLLRAAHKKGEAIRGEDKTEVEAKT